MRTSLRGDEPGSLPRLDMGRGPRGGLADHGVIVFARGEGERGESGAIKGEAANEFRGDVLGVHGAAAIPEEENLVAALEGMDQRSGQLGKAGEDLRVAKEGALHGDGCFDGVASTTFEL